MPMGNKYLFKSHFINIKLFNIQLRNQIESNRLDNSHVIRNKYNYIIITSSVLMLDYTSKRLLDKLLNKV